jgi:hypothetical protein
VPESSNLGEDNEEDGDLQEFPPTYVLSKKVLRVALDSGCTIKEKAQQERVKGLLPLRLCDLNYSDLPLTKKAVRDLLSAGATLTSEGRLRVSNAEAIRIGDLSLPAHKPSNTSVAHGELPSRQGNQVGPCSLPIPLSVCPYALLALICCSASCGSKVFLIVVNNLRLCCVCMQIVDGEVKAEEGDWDGDGVTLSQNGSNENDEGMDEGGSPTYGDTRSEGAFSYASQRPNFGLGQPSLKPGDEAEVQIISGPNTGSWIVCHIVEVKKNGTFDIYVGETDAVWNGPRFCKDIMTKYIRPKTTETGTNTLQIAEAMNSRAVVHQSINLNRTTARFSKYFKFKTYFSPSERDFQSDFSCFTVRPLDFVRKIEVCRYAGCIQKMCAMMIQNFFPCTL